MKNKIKTNENNNISKSQKELLVVFNRAVEIIENARRFVGRTADFSMCLTYYEIGRMIIEQEQGGEERAKYGEKIIIGLSAMLNNHFKKGFSERNLRNARKFYLVYEDRIRQSFIAKSGDESIQQSMIAKSREFRISWTHYLVLILAEWVHEFEACKPEEE